MYIVNRGDTKKHVTRARSFAWLLYTDDSIFKPYLLHPHNHAWKLVIQSNSCTTAVPSESLTETSCFICSSAETTFYFVASRDFQRSWTQSFFQSTPPERILLPGLEGTYNVATGWSNNVSH